MKLSPHKFVQVQGHLMVMQPFHVLNPVLYPIPVALYVPGMYVSSRIYKMKGVVDCRMAGNILQIHYMPSIHWSELLFPDEHVPE